MTALAVLAACTSTSRTATSQLNAQINAEIVDVDHTLHVGIDLYERIDPKTGLPIYYEIEPDEHVRLLFRDQTLDLLYAPGAYDFTAYRGTFALTGDVAAGEEIRVEIDRGADDDVIITAPAPPPFALVGPATWMHSQDLTITWMPVSTEPMAWRSEVGDGPIPTDTGTITFPAGVLASATSPYTSSVGVTFSRTARSNPASPLQSTYVSIAQERYILVEDQTP